MAKGSEDSILIESNLYKTKTNNSNLIGCIIYAPERNKYSRHYKPPLQIECSKEGGVL